MSLCTAPTRGQLGLEPRRLFSPEDTRGQGGGCRGRGGALGAGMLGVRDRVGSQEWGGWGVRGQGGGVGAGGASGVRMGVLGVRMGSVGCQGTGWGHQGAGWGYQGRVGVSGQGGVSGDMVGVRVEVLGGQGRGGGAGGWSGLLSLLTEDRSSAWRTAGHLGLPRES